MTDIYTSLFGTEPPWARRRGEDRRGTADPHRTGGLTIGGMVGNMGRNQRSAPEDRNRGPVETPAQFPFPMGEREPPTDDLSAEGRDRYARMRSEMEEWGAEAGRLARRAARRPRLPDVTGGEFGTDAANPANFMGGARREADRAAYATGTPLEYMEPLTGHESGDNPDARAPTSSATGLGQFIDDTWVRMMERYGPRYGFGDGHLADLTRADVLELRRDPMWARLMTAEYARENAPIIARAIRRNPTEGEVYLGHWLGPETAAALIKGVDEDQRREGRGRIARSLVSEEAFVANMPIFYTPDADVRLEGEGRNRRFVYHGGGRLRTAAEVYSAQTRAFRRDEFVARDYPTSGD